jgi:type III restriction enzyme
MAFARAFVTACRERGLHAVAITDHHDVCFVKYFQLAAQEERTTSAVPTPSLQDPIVFPGVELSLAVPCQAIVLLDAEAESVSQHMLLQACRIPLLHFDDAETGPQPQQLTFHTLEELDEALKSYSHGALKGRYILLPNVSDQGAHRTLLRNGFHDKYASMPCVGGYIECDWEGHTRKHVLEGQIKEWGHKAIGVFQTSDSRREDCQYLGCRSTWVKMAEPTAEALRQACLARQSRIWQTQPVLPTTYISRMEVSDSTFMGALDLEFNPQFNAIIGGRGTGKSTILEYLRRAMQDQPVEYESDIEPSDGVARKRQLIQDTLEKVRGRVAVHWILDQISHVVRYDSGTRELTLKVAGGQPTPATAEQVRRLLPIRAYSQKQLSSVSIRWAELQRFVEQPIQEELAQFEVQIAQQRVRIRDVYSRILARRQIERDLAVARTALTSLRERANAIEKALPKLSDDAAKAIKQHAARLREQQAREATEKDLGLAAEKLLDAENVLLSLPQGLNVEQNSPQGELLRAVYKDVGELIARAINGLKDARASLLAGSREVAERLMTWEATHEAHLRAHEAAEREAATHKVQMAQLHDLRNQEAEKQKYVTQLERELGTASDPEAEFTGLLDSWIDLHRQRGDALQRQCSRLAEMSDREIRAELVRGADIDDAIAKLREALKGAYISQDRWDTLKQSLREGGTAVEMWRTLMIEVRPLAETRAEDMAPDGVPATLISWDLTEKQRRAILDKLHPDAWLEITLTSLKDVPRFFYKTEEREIPFEQASAGQQATALLKALLNETGGPLIIDQPEEDLDNAIIETVVSLIWYAKQKRQIIFASHNANLVVNGDAELVIQCDYASEANRSRGQIKHQGAIDVRETRETITRVMEGGEKAFTLRRQKYGF